ncbi:MAG: hypothetical protein ACI8QS_000308 [Planctomycetota bacterium]
MELTSYEVGREIGARLFRAGAAFVAIAAMLRPAFNFRIRSSALWCQVWLLLSVLCSSPLAASGRDLSELHPMDGPDIDCRIRIDEEAVRFQLTMNLAFVDAIVDMGRELEESVHPVEMEGLGEALFEHFRDTNLVHLDGLQVTAVLAAGDSFTFTAADPKLVGLFPRFGARALAKVRLELDYPAKSKPAEVLMRWGVFPDNLTFIDPQGDAPPVEINAQLRASGVDELVVFREEAPEVRWSGELVSPLERFEVVPEDLPAPTWDVPVPSIALVLAGIGLLITAFLGAANKRAARLRIAFIGFILAVAVETQGHREIPAFFSTDSGLPDANSAASVFRPLQANIYRAFDYEEESDVYDALARSVEGPLLGELYGQIYRSLVQEEAGGAVSRVRSVEVSQAEVRNIERDEQDRPSFDVEATWRIEGVVFHWGHAHVRWNEYSAIYHLQRGEEGWRISACETLAERRIDAAPLLPASARSAEDELPGGSEF